MCTFTEMRVTCGVCKEKGHTQRTCEYSVRKKDKDLWSRKAEYYKRPQLLEEDEDMEEEYEDSSDDDANEEQMNENLVDGLPWMNHYGAAVWSNDDQFDGSRFHDDDDNDDNDE